MAWEEYWNQGERFQIEFRTEFQLELQANSVDSTEQIGENPIDFPTD